MFKSIGHDIVEVSRFKKYNKKNVDAFLKKVFFDSEIAYCFSFKEPSSHFAGIFSAKEAISKAMGVKKFPFIEIEIKHDKEVRPVAYRKGVRLKVLFSISHTKSIASSVALA